METEMTQIKLHDGSSGLGHRLTTLRRRLADGVKWWAEHQAWPATEDVRVDRYRAGRCR
jgi:hypothetical protein